LKDGPKARRGATAVPREASGMTKRNYGRAQVVMSGAPFRAVGAAEGAALELLQYSIEGPISHMSESICMYLTGCTLRVG